MRIAYIESTDRAGFAVSDGGGWSYLSDLGMQVDDLPTVAASVGHLREAMATDSAPQVTEGFRLRSPVVKPGKIVAAGANYGAHVREAGLPIPDFPFLFAKYPSSISAPDGPIELDRSLTSELDYESELVVVIGEKCRRVPESEALDYVLGYTVANDVSARDLQRRDGQLSRSKGMDTFCPVGPWITTADEVPDPQALWIRSEVNGEARQHSTTGDMLFSVAYLISYLSSTMTLHPGDVLLTGTPEGTALGQHPPSFLLPGDVVRCEVEGLGSIENVVVEVGV